jgi:hypothetical protein
MPQALTLTPSDIADACDRYAGGETIRVAADSIGIPWQRLWGHLQERGLLRAARTSPRPRVAVPAVAATRACRRRELTFGVEFEVYLPSEHRINLGSYHHGVPVPGLPEGWTAESDGSLTTSPPAGHYGAEIVSPVLSGEDGARQVIAVLKWLNERGARVTRSCGFHVHVGWKGTRQQLRKLVRLFARHERAFYASTGTRSRENGTYCRPILNDPWYGQLGYNPERVRLNRVSRYHSLNVANVGKRGKSTVEFRVFAGTTNVVKVLAYASMALGLVAHALDEATEEPPGLASSRAASGCAALAELLGLLQWHTRQPALAGPADLPSTMDMAFELGRLAQKYDGVGPEVEAA